ncbi:NDP-sugar epimerase, includes UDP-GlcNAc-inverting 4,6-dehydratase FlaA1 and capsular polysaccharide biosynthesis protein EpsC [Desulfacinum infernum DSM 9756]|jgi:FlaA1/EpsC-like NDP-sugar epimerase|uniref:NDP-sugar epimerase, includes UDP-GlcNAc-inverting 4,6-dehydratase FlaA1 and capsular polysaccharide biosynthesis protein EpsC n=1 Tax=Desulfacinum infernum DSM 9756 TaxID=1121391 RepID=A0A1M4SW87_9BACT|nr:nucleoside-diphosphate sugar epimerase/dehydratase [Desulfacinum infernum]SHE36297.1 NDP-sugar epimerase, includes UDP-GlcNAc-inverting 4,6-dehydratase FlaA1 and capsular polysaccharide biosynthesis protein EpsC [Desulfacinum infernum DSM 9756]
MMRQLKNPKLYLMILLDAVCFASALYAAYLVRFEMSVAPYYQKQFLRLCLWLVPLQSLTFWAFGLYRGMWRYTSSDDVIRLIQAVVTSTLAAIAVVLYANRFMGYSRSVFVLQGVFSFLFAGGVRLAIRWGYTRWGHVAARERGGHAGGSPGKRKSPRRVLVVGAGSAGEKLVREIQDNPGLSYRIVGFVDDDHQKWGRRLHGIPVLGGVHDLSHIAQKKRIDEIFLAVPSASGDAMRRITQACEESGIPYKTLPGIGQLMTGQVSVEALRKVNYEDLLGRPPVKLETETIRAVLEAKRVLVTGAGGSIGSELCRQIVRFDPSELILLDASEANLFRMETELAHEAKRCPTAGYLGRVQDRVLMEEIFRRHRPQIVFHAAACKHVPFMERYPWEAVYNNVLGSRVVMEAAVGFGVERFVLVSTDKAVRPANVMGASKRAAELLMQSLQGNGTRFMAVRFGNVVGSSGSVVPLFRRQIERGGPVTVTHPDATRYFMTIPEAAQLILQAAAMGRGGEIFILKMGTAVRIADMARDLIRLSGKEPDRDVRIVFTGLREGEKLTEELITDGEDVVPTPHDEIMVLRCNGIDPAELHRSLAGQLEALCRAAETHDREGIIRALRRMVPEYDPGRGFRHGS